MAEPIKLSLKLGCDLTPGVRRSSRTHPRRRGGRSFKIVSSRSQEPTASLISILRSLPDWADRVKERGVRRERTLYNHEMWVEHRSSLRHVRHLVSSLSSRVILSLVPPVTVFTAFAAAIAGYNSVVAAGWLPQFFPILRASSLPYQLTAPALALLLVFRTEASYSRFQEGRQAWTKVIASTNDLARQVIAIGGRNTSDDLALWEALLGYIVAFPVALKVKSILRSNCSICGRRTSSNEFTSCAVSFDLRLRYRGGSEGHARTGRSRGLAQVEAPSSLPHRIHLSEPQIVEHRRIRKI